MRTADIVRLLGIARPDRVADRYGLVKPIGTGNRRTWSPGDALAVWVLHELAGDRYVEGARKAGEALDNGFAPAFLLTRGDPEYLVVVDGPDADRVLAELLLQATDAGLPVRVVNLRKPVALLMGEARQLSNA